MPKPFVHFLHLQYSQGKQVGQQWEAGKVLAGSHSMEYSYCCHCWCFTRWFCTKPDEMATAATHLGGISAFSNRSIPTE